MAKNENPHKAKDAKKNAGLSRAKKAKQDEFYTQYEDIQNELNHYEHHFKGKTVLCNCDDPFESNFCKYFLRNFNYLKLKRLICTSYFSSPVVGRQMDLFDTHNEKVQPGRGYVMDVSEVPMENNRGVSDADIDRLLTSGQGGVKRLSGNGDFRSPECVGYLKQADIVVTNPPFSLFREYVAQLVEYDKKFLIIGNINAITYKEIFPLIKANKLWLGYRNLNKDMYFNVEAAYQKYLVENKKEGSAYKIIDGVVMGRLASACWYTNIDHNKRHEKLVLYKRYYGNESEYPKYDNYDAINVDKVSDIPCDYFACAGVPITFLDKYNPDQFEIVNANTIKTNDAVCEKPHGLIKDKEASITIKKGLTRGNSGTESLTDSRQQTADSRQQTADSRQQTADSRQQTDSGLYTHELSSGGRCNGIMGVPITFLDKYSPEQFEIVGATESEGKGFSNGLWNNQSGISQPIVCDERKYKRIFIKRRV